MCMVCDTVKKQLVVSHCIVNHRQRESLVRRVKIVFGGKETQHNRVESRFAFNAPSNHHAPYVLGYTRNTMAVNRGMQNREVERTPKSRPSSDRGLQPAHVKSESLVIADQHAAVNTFPGLVHTARHTTRVCNTRSR